MKYIVLCAPEVNLFTNHQLLQMRNHHKQDNHLMGRGEKQCIETYREKRSTGRVGKAGLDVVNVVQDVN